MPEIQESPLIKGVQIVSLRAFEDERGRFIETFRKEWFPSRKWENVQSNRSDSRQNVLRGLHYHRQQVDYWYVPAGMIRAGLVDLRPNSSTYMATQTVEMGDENQVGLFIPVGVAHGFLALTNCTLMYIVDNYYDSTDEYGLLWNDSQVNLNWGIDNPILSERDLSNPRLENIPQDVFV
jgi:dTDP-4-dehydrorhamnose 3,5-epimerase